MLNRCSIRIAAACALVMLGCGHSAAEEDLGHGYVRRGEAIHFEGGGLTGGNETGGGGTRIDQASDYEINQFRMVLRRRIVPCRSPDAASFVAMSEEYTRDKKTVYYKWISPGRFVVVELPMADRASFKPINTYYAADKNAIWYMDRPIAGSDPKTAKLVAHAIIKDADHVYISGRVKWHLDPATFGHLGSAYYVDKNGVYWGDRRVDGVDTKTFRVLGDSFMAVDKNRVYRSGQPMPGFDAATCKLIVHEPVGYQVFSDKNGVYVNGIRILHADPDDFVMLDEVTAKGGKHVFLIDSYQFTPMTLYREDNCLIVEAFFYNPSRTKPMAIVKAEVTDKALKDVEVNPPPGADKAGKLELWQLSALGREDLVKQMNEAAQRLTAPPGAP